MYGTVAFIAEDLFCLGSLWLEGFVTNFFNSKALLSLLSKLQRKFQNSLSTLGELRTEANYNAAVRAIRTLLNENNDGIKFNELEFFHDAYPGLPPYLGRDLFEGIVQYDFPVFVKYLVENKWFNTKFTTQRSTRFSFKMLIQAHLLCL